MTLGKDVSALFPDVLKNIATQDLDQKKLVYLYLMYALLVFRSAYNILIDAGTMPNLTQTYVFSQLTHLFKTQKIRTRLFVRSRYGQWAA
jgi:hypothetical protein